ncbi:ABC transporter substrate-binding protein [Ornithinibacillus sp. 4-3]|uniref:ABC transporter substrate-binding protein n=1 Tax=Ornithinibacillus sp. 4-3 TaxID=3231488 RepID=A0AB39HQ41_9BACI
MYLSKTRILLAFGLLLAVLIGCSSNSDGGSDTDNEQQEGEEQTQEGGTLNFAFHLQPPSLDPHTNTDIGTRDISQHIFEALVTMNSSLEVEPMLAEDFEISDDGKEVTFNLREGILFHNGEEMTAEDVIASLERWQSLSSQAQTYHGETTFEAADEYTVIAHIPNPSTMDMYIFADMTQFAAIMPKEIVEEAGAEIVSDYIGTGPYQFSEFRQDQYVHLVRNENYQSRTEASDALAGEKKAILDEIYFHFVTDASTRVAGLQSGEYDIANAIPQDSAMQLESSEDIQLNIAANSFPTLIFNKSNGVFSDLEFRKIANTAINVEDMLIAAYGNENYYVKDHALVQEEQAGWYSEAGKDIFETYDPELAKEMLEESDYDGEEIVILTSRENPDEYNMSVVAEESLKSIGMNVTLAESDWGTVLEKREDEEAWDIFFTSFAMRPMPTQYLFLNQGWFGWTDSEELRSLGEQIVNAGSIEEAQQFKDDYHQAFWEYLPVIKPGNKTGITALRSNVEGFDYLTGPIVWNVTIDK